MCPCSFPLHNIAGGLREEENLQTSIFKIEKKSTMATDNETSSSAKKIDNSKLVEYEGRGYLHLCWIFVDVTPPSLHESTFLSVPLL